MQPQVFDGSVRFVCGSCTKCCDQPWNTLIESSKARALDNHDFSAYPHLAGRKFYSDEDRGKPGYHRLAKGEGTRCLFLDHDGLCIIHKELGAEAKPSMCRQFPFLPSPTRVDDRISANFGCPSVQSDRGERLTDQASGITGLVPRTQRAPMPDSPTPLDGRLLLTPGENDALIGRTMRLFDASMGDDIWQRFATLLATLVTVRDLKSGAATDDKSLEDRLRSDDPLPGLPSIPPIHRFDPPDQSPMPVRMLFAATLFPDAIPPDTMSRVGMMKRLTLIPKLLAIATLKGGYPSRILNRNVCVRDVIAYDVGPDLEPAATTLLVRYFHSRFWQRMLVGTRLNLLAGVHQHIHDFNAILFFARAEAQHSGSRELSKAIVGRAMTAVEFHLANQDRLFQQALKGWFRRQLSRPELAVASLRLMALREANVSPTALAVTTR